MAVEVDVVADAAVRLPGMANNRFYPVDSGWSSSDDVEEVYLSGSAVRHPSYPDFCIPPPPPDLDCGNFTQKNFRVRHDVPNPDPHRLDSDRDGVGCET